MVLLNVHYNASSVSVQFCIHFMHLEEIVPLLSLPTRPRMQTCVDSHQLRVLMDTEKRTLLLEVQRSSNDENTFSSGHQQPADRQSVRSQIREPDNSSWIVPRNLLTFEFGLLTSRDQWRRGIYISLVKSRRRCYSPDLLNKLAKKCYSQ